MHQPLPRTNWLKKKKKLKIFKKQNILLWSMKDEASQPKCWTSDGSFATISPGLRSQFSFTAFLRLFLQHLSVWPSTGCCAGRGTMTGTMRADEATLAIRCLARMDSDHSYGTLKQHLSNGFRIVLKPSGFLSRTVQKKSLKPSRPFEEVEI